MCSKGQDGNGQQGKDHCFYHVKITISNFIMPINILINVWVINGSKVGSVPVDLGDVCLAEAYSADGAFSISMGGGIINTFLAENVGTGLQSYLSLPVGSASTHYF